MPSESLTPVFNEQLPATFDRLEVLERQRVDFISQLVGGGLISAELANSGELSKFIIDEPTNYDGLKHILVGDNNGGSHHLSTVFKLDQPDFNVVAASQLRTPRLKRYQSVKQNGTYHPKSLIINDQEKQGGSAMFPIEWSTEAVIRNMLAVAQTAPESHDIERAAYIHKGYVEGVNITVVTSERNGKIITGFPVVPRKQRQDGTL